MGESHDDRVRLSLALSLATAMHFDGFLQRGLPRFADERGTARAGPVGISRYFSQQRSRCLLACSR